MNAHHLSRTLVALVLALLASAAAADGTTHAMGYLTPPKGGFKVTVGQNPQPLDPSSP